MLRKLFILNGLVISVLVVIVVLMNRFATSKLPETPKDKTSVVATFYPLAEFTRQVGGDFVSVTTLVPAGAEPHEYEPTPQQLAVMQRSRLLVYNGAGFEIWLTTLLPELESSGVKTVNTSESIDLISRQAGENNIVTYDPHVWLDPKLAQKQVEAIKQALIALDPGHRIIYEQRAQNYIQELQELDQAYRVGLNKCTHKEIITSHAAFAYLAQEYGFTMYSITGVSPESEPSPQQLADLSNLADSRGINYIFFESLVSPKLAQTLADEVGISTLVFDPLEGLNQTQLEEQENYISIMKQNLKNLTMALVCQ